MRRNMNALIDNKKTEVYNVLKKEENCISLRMRKGRTMGERYIPRMQSAGMHMEVVAYNELNHYCKLLESHLQYDNPVLIKAL